MATVFDYRDMAREYLAAAEACEDAERRIVLLGIAQLYNQTASFLEAAEASPLVPRANDLSVE